MNIKIKDLDDNLKPRERFIKYGSKALSDDELLAIILKTGTKNCNVKLLATKLISSIGGINNLINVTLEELIKIDGIGKVKAIEILTSIELGKRVLNNVNYKVKLNNNDYVYDMFKYDFIGETQEKLLAIFLDNNNQLINYKVIFIGTVNKTITHPREIFKSAVKLSASKIVLIHNHPSGNIKPSSNDEIFTDKIKRLGNEMDIPLVDHLIIGQNGYYSIFNRREYLYE